MPEIAEVVGALRGLVRTGAYEHRFRDLPTLSQLPAVDLRVRPQAGVRAKAEVAMACFFEAINDTSDPSILAAYRWLFALTLEAEQVQHDGGVQARRTRALDILVRSSCLPFTSVETWRRTAEASFLVPLAERLIKLPANPSEDEDHEYVRARRAFFVNGSDVLTRTEAIFTVRSIRDGHASYIARAQNEADLSNGVLKPERLFGCDIEVLEVRGGIMTFRVAFDRVLAANALHEYGYRVVSSTAQSLRSETGISWVRGQVRRGYNVNELSVHLESADEIESAWWFVTASELEVPGLLAPKTRLRLDPDGWLVRGFPALPRNYFFGIAWRRN